jgi:uncharacterized protein YciI
MFSVDDPATIERFAKADPYVVHGLVMGYKIRQWNTVCGANAFQQVRPAA